MGKISKKRAKANEKVDSEKFYNLQEAMALVKEVNTTKFDASVDVHIRLGIDPRKADQALRGTVSLPNGTGKNKTVLVLCTPDKEEEAKAAGADYVGLDDYIQKISGENILKCLSIKTSSAFRVRFSARLYIAGCFSI